ncbi:Glycoprotein 6-alpha-L-fucosyltransferase [Bertholletia excelsa]
MSISGTEMEPSNSNHKSLDRLVSQKALQMGSSFPCQICVAGFLCGVCLTTLFLAALTSFGTFAFGGISFSTLSIGMSTSNSSADINNMVTYGDCNTKPKEIGRTMYLKESGEHEIDHQVSLLYSAWSELLKKQLNGEGELLQSVGWRRSNLPKAPHLENCKLREQVNKHLDIQVENESFPPWTMWKGFLDIYSLSVTDEQLKYYRNQTMSEGAYPPWITGSDEENYPLTRKVQRDIWVNQHPLNCSDTNVRFLVADWEKLPGFGIGAQIAGMCGLLAIAINEKRVLVTNYYNRADHDGCRGSSRSSWSCYFFPETSQECRDRAFQLMGKKEAWEKGIITGRDNYTSRHIWAGPTPRNWGSPWSYLQPTTEINGTFIAYHRKMDRRWWRAQAVRYLMRFQTEYTCNLLNVARHSAFGWEAAKLVLATPTTGPKDVTDKSVSDMEQYVWSNHKPWMPRPLLSMHVRMGDKACEMRVVEFEEYMHLADRIRKRFPHLIGIWLSTEMQDVIDKTRLYPHWKFYHTKNVTRQVGNITMATYEASLGRETSTNYPLVNFLMAAEADFFIGALGSTWCYLIDGMRNTGGKVMAGYLSVNKDRFW